MAKCLVLALRVPLQSARNRWRERRALAYQALRIHTMCFVPVPVRVAAQQKGACATFRYLMSLPKAENGAVMMKAGEVGFSLKCVAARVALARDGVPPRAPPGACPSLPLPAPRPLCAP